MLESKDGQPMTHTSNLTHCIPVIVTKQDSKPLQYFY